MGRVVRDERGQMWEQLDSGDWAPYDELASNTGAGEAFLVQAGAQLARFGRGAQNIAAGLTNDYEWQRELAERQAESDRLLGGLSDYQPAASFAGTMAPALATIPFSGGLGTAIGIGAAEGALSYRPDLKEQLLLGGALGGAFGGAGFTAGNLATRVAGKIGRMVGRRSPFDDGAETTGNATIYRESVEEAQTRVRGDRDEALELLGNEPGRRAGRMANLNPEERWAAEAGNELGWRFEAADFNRPLQQLRAAASSNPLTSGVADYNQRMNAELLSDTVAQGIGLPPGRGLGTGALGDASELLRGRFEQLGGLVDNVNLSKTRSVAEDIVEEGKRGIGGQNEGTRIAQELLEQTEKGAVIDGERALLWRSELMSAYRKATAPTSSRADTVAAERLDKLIESVDSAFQRSMPQQYRNLYKTSREQYRLLRAIRRGAAVTEAGDVNVRSMGNQLKRAFRREYAEGRDMNLEQPVRDALRLTRVANVFNDGIGDSGTATRMALTQMEPATLAINLASRPLGGAYGRLMQTNPTTPGMYGFGAASRPGSVGAAVMRGLWAAGQLE